MKRIAAAALTLCLLLAGCGSTPEEAPQTTAGAIAETTAETTLPPQTAAETEATVPEETPGTERFLLSFVGDCTLGADPSLAGSQLSFLKVVGEDYGYPFRNVRSWFVGDEFTYVNLEGTLTDSGHPVNKRYRFSGPQSYVQILQEASVEAVSLANNHSMDFGQTGMENTCRTLTEAGIPYVERDSTLLVETEHGLTIGLYGAVYYHIDREAMEAAIRDLRDQADLVIFVPHWGSGLAPHPNREQIELAHAAIDAGADLVCGSHPHVLQDMEYYGDGIIFYSMGNFCFGGNPNPSDMDTAIWQQEVLRGPDGTVSLGEVIVIPCSVSSAEDINNYQPTPYKEDTVAYDRVLRKLGMK